MMPTAEHQRLLEHRERRANWKHWGPYLSERAWGTVREDNRTDDDVWTSFPHDHARSRAYRWNEDGLAGISDRNQYLCFALALWNGRDPILKERLFGLSGPEGNHGEDVKEVYYYLDNTPTHSYMRLLYRYPQAAFPYADLVAENRRRGYDDFEYELFDTGAFDENRYFDIEVEYAKAGPDDVVIRVTVANRGPEPAVCHVLPTVWFRNTWSWGYPTGPMNDVPEVPRLEHERSAEGVQVIRASHAVLGTYRLFAEHAGEVLFTENATNAERILGQPNAQPYVKDAFHRYVVQDDSSAVNPARHGTKAAACYQAALAPGESWTARLRLAEGDHTAPFAGFDECCAQRLDEADAFYAAVQAPGLSAEERRIQRQAFAGMLWTKQLYYYDVPQWLAGDPTSPPRARPRVRNREWEHLHNFDVISMPDKWEYPWYACWDLAFHCIPLVMLDPDYAKRQLELMTREWYMHPNGQLPAYEWNYGDVNPPVHAWAAWRVYQLDAQASGRPDRAFLEGIFHKLLLNFTWWVNRKDVDGRNVFQGGFLGLDNISLFDRSKPLPTGGHIDQSDGTAWMAVYCLEMLRIALELAKENPVYQDTATKFFEHFLRIAYAMAHPGGQESALWDDEDGFFYDQLHLPDGRMVPLKVRSLVGLLPLIAVEILEPEILETMPVFDRRIHWFLENRPELSGEMADVDRSGEKSRHLLAILTPERMRRVLRTLLDESEFLSSYGIRSLSKHHQVHPYRLTVNGQTFHIAYEPAESRSGLFGGNSNWRGPIWFPINYLLIEALRKFHRYYGDGFRVECPTGSGTLLTLDAVADELCRRLARIFLPDAEGRRPVYGGVEKPQSDPHWRDQVLFYEYFNGDDGAGLGASHQTGWTGLVAEIIQEIGASRGAPGATSVP